ncbi:G-box-binding factor [Lucilia cuprina]|uniref:G-box-binding factor n=1 Tax=Lucilia cuprina TaxID=7375 RepID=UPI001F059338|nr:G-box-binding factor [Lucilia cuprina]
MVRNFSPRMDYNNNEWRPVGRGDPLKNDPTFDYSPPTLDRVRYWADSDKEKDKTEEVSAALVDAKLKKANPGKNEILLLGVTGDRMRGGAPVQQHVPHMLKNAKGETPLLQPKYTSIRRSYYAHQLPTHLMPPPMQPMQPATQQHQLQSSSQMQQHQPQQQQSQSSMQSQSQHHQVSAMHMVKPAHSEYRHNMPGHSYMTSSPMSSMSVHSKPYYMSTATQPWMHTTSSASKGGASTSSSSVHSPLMMSGNSHRYSHPQTHDSYHQESVNYVTYHSRPSLTSTPSIMLGMNVAGHHEIYSPNSIRGSSSGHHKSTLSSSRKPWIHDLLQKEFIKPVKPTQNPNSYHVDTIKSSHMEPQQHFEPDYATTSNLAYRPTVAPVKMTTDSLFSHYNQPEKPLRGPMYLIIEGHSKVKTYGKDELDPHKPKIVPVIPKREPVVRMADPNEKRGTPETFQVKHLHTKTTKPMETSATKPTVTKATTAKPAVTKATTTKHAATKATTAKPAVTKATTPKPPTATKTTTKQPAAAMKTTTTTTVKPKTTMKTTTTTKPTAKKVITSTTTTTTKPSKISVTTTPIPAKPKFEKIDSKEVKSSGKDELKMSAKLTNPNALEAPQKPSQTLINEPPTAMQGFLSFLDSSLDSIFKEEPMADNDSQKEMDSNKDTTTKLKPIAMKPSSPQQIEARVSTKLEAIKAEDYEDYVDDNYFQMTTEYIPRETRQVFDYDQLPESRINLKDDANFGDFLEQIDDEDDLSTFNFDDEYEDEDEEEIEGQKPTQIAVNSSNKPHNLIKRIDSLVSSSVEDDFDDLSSLVDGDDDDLTEDVLPDLPRNQPRQQQQPQAKKA